MIAPLQRNVDVIGAGPAGSVAAIALAKLGHAVTLFEKTKFPRDKVCGECLSATGVTVLTRLGLAENMQEALAPTILRRASAVATDGSMSVVDLPEAMWGLTRRSMDRWLADAAIAAGARIEWRAFNAAIDAASKIGGERAHFTVLADGRGNSISRVQPTSDFGIKAHFRNVAAERDLIELVALRDGGYAGLAPVNGDLWNAAWSVPAALLKRHRGDVDALFKEAVARSPHLRQRFARAQRAGDWLTCPLPRHAVRRDWPTNLIPVGNAAAALEPVGGEGMGLAMRSAELAAEAIGCAARTLRPVDTDALKSQFNDLWRVRRTACRGAALVLAHPVGGPLAIGIAARMPALARAGLTLIGK